MRNPFLSRRAFLSAFALAVAGARAAASRSSAAEIPASMPDAEFWRLVTDLSEAGGVFPLQFMSNEDSAQFVLPQLNDAVRPGGVFIGVGSEQNFTYIAAMRPKIAFVIDIRRDNMVEHLMYKALFEQCDNRADFVSRLFARRRPVGLTAGASAKDIFEAFRLVEPDPAYYEQNLRAVVDRLVTARKFPLSDADKIGVGRMMNAFRTAGPFSLKGFGDATNPTYAQLMSATDLQGRNQGYLASEENYRAVRDLQGRNLIVPLVGDFAGDKAIPGVGRYLADHSAVVNAFYVSNVERYLFEQGDHGRQFYVNVTALPRDPSSVFVRSVTSDISVRLGIPIPENSAKWRTFLYSIADCLKGLDEGRIQSYRDLIVTGRSQ